MNDWRIDFNNYVLMLQLVPEHVNKHPKEEEDFLFAVTVRVDYTQCLSIFRRRHKFTCAQTHRRVIRRLPGSQRARASRYHYC